MNYHIQINPGDALIRFVSPFAGEDKVYHIRVLSAGQSIHFERRTLEKTTELLVGSFICGALQWSGHDDHPARYDIKYLLIIQQICDTLTALSAIRS